jgi:hypothetical protein
MMTDLRTVFLLIQALDASEAEEFSQFNVLCDNAGNHSPVGGFGL